MDRIVIKDRCPTDAQMRFDFFHQHTAEQIRPAVILGDADARFLHRLRQSLPVGLAVGRGGQQVDAAKAIKGFGHAEAGGRKKRIGFQTAKAQGVAAAAAGGQRQKVRAILHQSFERGMGAVPFQHGEFGRMQRAALAVAEHTGEIKHRAFPRRNQLFAGKFRRCMQKIRLFAAVGVQKRDFQPVQMGFIAGRALQLSGLDLDKILRQKPVPQRGFDPVAGQKQRAAVLMAGGGPEGGLIAHRGQLLSVLREKIHFCTGFGGTNMGEAPAQTVLNGLPVFRLSGSDGRC